MTLIPSRQRTTTKLVMLTAGALVILVVLMLFLGGCTNITAAGRYVPSQQFSKADGPCVDANGNPCVHGHKQMLPCCDEVGR